MSGTLLSLGHGYTARALAVCLPGWRIIGTTRSAAGAEALRARGVEPLIWPGTPLTPALARATHLLCSIPPGAEGDPVLAAHEEEIAAARHLTWVGYLSTTGVYGDRGGGWVDEKTPLEPADTPGARRVAAEAAWRDIAARGRLALHIFRLAGIYGPGRSAFDRLRAGTARRIVKPGQVFSRIHVEDIAQVLAASIARPQSGAIYNVCDDVPAPPEEVIEAAAALAGLPLPPAERFEAAEMTPMMRSFYSTSRRVSNARIKADLGVRLRYRDYRTGLAAIFAAEQAATAGPGGAK